jgi:hypothetical protein
MSPARIIVALLCFGMATGCTQPRPGPVPVPTPITDRFSARVFDCRQDVVAVERDSAKPDVGDCLAKATPTVCLLTLGQYNDATVACLARDLGATANARVLAGSTDPADAAKADGARSFINEYMGFQ